MTKEEIDDQKERIRLTVSIPEILARYGVTVRGGRCKAICHDGDNLTAKVSQESYYCFKCNQKMDVFDLTAHFNHCDFWTAFEILGGTKEPSRETVIRTNKAIEERRRALFEEQQKNLEIRQIQRKITAYRNIIREEGKTTELCVYCYNRMQYELYKLEVLSEKR